MPPAGNWLLVEDDVVDAMTVRRALSSLGHAVEVATTASAPEAQAYLEGCRAEPASRRPSLLLLDLDLPKSGGLELLVEVKCDPTWRSVPVVVLTTSDCEKDARRAYDRGAAGYFVKPVQFDRFADVVQAIFTYWSLAMPPPARDLPVH